MRTWRLLIGGLAAAAVVATVGCTGGGVGSSDEGTIRVMTWGNNADTASIQAAAEGFSEANPDIKVEFETGDCAADYAACKLLIAGRNMPDVIIPGSWNYYELVRDGVLADLTPYIEESDLAIDDFTPAVINSLTTDDGQLYALPMGFNVQSLYYNKDMFAAAGIEEPPADGSYTYDDMRQWAKKLTLDANGNNAESANFDPKSIVQWGYTNLAVDPGYLQATIPILKAYGGGILDGDNRNQCVIDKPESIKAFQFLQDMMYTDQSMITPALNQEKPGYLRWVNGQVAMQQGSHEQVLLVAEQNADMPFDMAALPKGPEGNSTLIQIHNWAMYEGSQKKDAAWDFINYMATEGAGKQMGLIPAYKDVAQGEAFAQAEGEPEHVVEAQLDPVSWPLAWVAVDPAVIQSAVNTQDGLAPAIEDIMANRQTAEDALGGICADRIDKLIERQQ